MQTGVRSLDELNNHLLLLKRVVTSEQTQQHDFGCPICISNNRCAKSPTFRTIKQLLNHLRGKHPDEETRRSVQNLAKNLQLAIELGMIKN